MMGLMAFLLSSPDQWVERSPRRIMCGVFELVCWVKFVHGATCIFQCVLDNLRQAHRPTNGRVGVIPRIE